MGPQGKQPDAGKPDKVQAQDIAPVEIAVGHPGSALGKKEFFRHADEKHEPGEEIRPVKGAPEDTEQAGQERESYHQ